MIGQPIGISSEIRVQKSFFRRSLLCYKLPIRIREMMNDMIVKYQIRKKEHVSKFNSALWSKWVQFNIILYLELKLWKNLPFLKLLRDT